MDATPKLKVMFTVHIGRMLDNSYLQSFAGWIRSLDPFLGLELTGIDLSQYSIKLKRLASFGFIVKVFEPVVHFFSPEPKSDNNNPQCYRA